MGRVSLPKDVTVHEFDDARNRGELFEARTMLNVKCRVCPGEITKQLFVGG